MEAAKVIISVVAGIIPNVPMPEHTRQFGLTGQEMHEGTPEERQSAWNRAHGEAMMYATQMMNPGMVNWVRLEWIWL
jgi:hypothetical protein